MKQLRNTFNTMPLIPYNILQYLMTDNGAENFWKALKYPTYDCLSKPNLTLDEKSDLVCFNQTNQENYSIFLTQIVENMIPDEKPILKIYKIKTGFESVTNGKFSIGDYRFDILYGGKIGVIEYQATPVNRGDFIEMELLKSLNGAEINGGAGFLEFNNTLSRNCGSYLGLGNSTTYTGVSVVMAIRLANFVNTGC
jgi:hypothetical protein